MRNIIKMPVRGTDFFERPKVIKKIQRLLDSDRSVLISGPPKSGKTSILFFLSNNLPDYYNFKYVNVAAIREIDEYYTEIRSAYSGIRVSSIFYGSDEEKPIAERWDNAFYENIIEELKNYNREESLVIMIDNFSGMLENIYKNEGPDNVVHFLNIEQQLRKYIETSKSKVQFIYSSDIDIETIAEKFNAGQSFSDLYSYSISTLLKLEAEDLIAELSENMNFELDKAQLDYLFQKIPLQYPFNIQLALFELESLYEDRDLTEIEYSIIDEAIERVLKHKDFIGPRELPHKDEKVIKKFKNIKLQRIKIQHIKCFEDVDIGFDPSINTSLIIGTNGKGKSTILQLIALGLSGIKNIPFPYNWKEVVKKNSSRGLFEIDILFDNKPIHLKFEIDGKDDSIACSEGSDQLETMRDTFVLLAYGVNRSYKLEDTRPYKDLEPIATLFGENGYLKHIKISANFECIQEHFQTIQILINKVLEKANGGDKVILTRYDSSSFYFHTPSNPEKDIPMEALSEGFKSTLVWLLDAVIRIVEKGGSLENATDITGFILLDEVDLHLHPSWQRTILHSIETLFPNIQFIVTTHSPFVVQSANMESLIALEMKEGSDNVIVVDKNITSSLSYNAIVREIFNIPFPFSREIEQEMDKFREMQAAIRDNREVDMKKFEEVVMAIAGKGVELEGIMRREIMSLEQRTGKSFGLWKK
ncbi:MAG: AAA family ATPase [Candidatus Aminicenantes bacterium]|nr:AAA family ATPase [Candidatus Aminicenantes bacterium]